MTPLPSAVVLDFFGTLVEVDRDALTMAEFLTSRGYPCSERLELLWNSRGYDGLSTPRSEGGAYESWRANNVRELCRMAGVPEEEVESFASELLDNDRSWTVRATVGCHAFMQRLADQSIPHVICSNWDYPIEPYLAQAGLAVAPTVISAEVGYRKPAPELLHAALARIDVAPGPTVWFVGDSWGADAVGAIRAGLHPVLISDEPSSLTRHVTTVPSLDRLAEILEDLIGNAAG